MNPIKWILNWLGAGSAKNRGEIRKATPAQTTKTNVKTAEELINAIEAERTQK